MTGPVAFLFLLLFCVGLYFIGRPKGEGPQWAFLGGLTALGVWTIVLLVGAVLDLIRAVL